MTRDLQGERESGKGVTCVWRGKQACLLEKDCLLSLLCPPGGAVANLCVVLFVTFEVDSQRVAIHVALNAELQCMLPSMPRILSATV